MGSRLTRPQDSYSRRCSYSQEYGESTPRRRAAASPSDFCSSPEWQPFGRYSFRDGSDAARNHLWRRIHIGWQRTDHDSAPEIGASTNLVGTRACFANGVDRGAHGKATATALKFEDNQFRNATSDSAIGRSLDKTQNPFCFSARSERSDFGSSCFRVAW